MAKASLLLVGGRVSQLQPFFEERGYPTTAVKDGTPAIAALRDQAVSVVVLELELNDMIAREFIKEAQKLRPGCKFLLLEDPAKAHRIIAAMVQGISTYMATPPDDSVFPLVDQLAGTGSEDELRAQIAELEQEVARLKSKVTARDDRTQNVFADATVVSSVEESSEIQIAIPHDDEADQQRTQRLDAEFERLKTQMMPAQARVRGSDDYRRVVEGVWSQVPDTNPEGSA